MKKILMIAFVLVTVIANAQTETDYTKVKFFKKENVFAGGDFGIFFGSGSFAAGLTPFIGYSLTDYLDAGVSFNFNYQSARDVQYAGDALRNTTYGPGAFVRLFPLSTFYLQAQFERNFLSAKYIFPSNFYNSSEKRTGAASSYLFGAGYCNGREEGSNFYYYVSILFDAGNDINSPYIDQYGRKDPIIRAGFNFPLFGGGNGGGSSREARRSRRADD
jgi:hypothetical protein